MTEPQIKIGIKKFWNVACTLTNKRTAMEQVEYKLCLAPQFHQEPRHLHHCYLLLSNERTLLVQFLAMRVGKWQTCLVARIQISHQLLYQTLLSPQSAGCYNCSTVKHYKTMFFKFKPANSKGEIRVGCFLRGKRFNLTTIWQFL